MSNRIYGHSIFSDKEVREAKRLFREARDAGYTAQASIGRVSKTMEVEYKYAASMIGKAKRGVPSGDIQLTLFG